MIPDPEAPPPPRPPTKYWGFWLAVIGVIGLCLLAFAERGNGAETKYVRSEGKYRVVNGGHCWHVAKRVFPQGTPQQLALVAVEVRLMNGAPRNHHFTRGDCLRVPLYRASPRGATFPRWHAAVCASERGARLADPAVAVATSLHENPSAARSWYACGVGGGRGQYHGLRAQMKHCVRIWREQIGDGALHPTRAQVRKVANRFPEDPGTRDHWTGCVWSIYAGRLRP